MESITPIMVSISCITYNHAPYIRQCLDGFIMQKTSFAFEVLIHDDCSTDGTTEIIKEYEAKYPNIIKPLYETENQYQQGKPSGSAVWNFPRAKGKYIAICEGDDYWIDPYKLQKQVDFLEANPEYSMCFHNVNVVAEGCKLATNLYEHLQDKDYTVEEFISRWTIPTCSVVMRRFITHHVPKDNRFVVGDNVLFTTCALHGKIRCINEKMGCYRRNVGGWTNGKGIAEKFVKHYEAMMDAFPTIDKEIFDRERLKSLVSLFLEELRKFDRRCFATLLKGVKGYHFLFVGEVVRRVYLKIGLSVYRKW